MPGSPNLLEGNLEFSDRGSPESRSEDSLSPFRKRQYCYQCEAVHCLTEQKKSVIQAAVHVVVDENYSEDNPKLLRYKVYRTIHDEFLDDGEDPLQDGDRPFVPGCARAYVQTLIGDNYLRPALARHMWLARINKAEWEEEQQKLTAQAGQQDTTIDESVTSPGVGDEVKKLTTATSSPKSKLLVEPMQSLCGTKVKSVVSNVPKTNGGQDQNVVNQKFLIDGSSGEGRSGITVRIHNDKSSSDRNNKKKPASQKKKKSCSTGAAARKKPKVDSPSTRTKTSAGKSAAAKASKKKKKLTTETEVAVASRSSTRVVKRKKWEESSSDESAWEDEMRAKSRKAAAVFKKAVLEASADSDGDSLSD